MMSVADISLSVSELLVDLEIVSEPMIDYDQDLRACTGVDSLSFSLLACAIEEKFGVNFDLAQFEESHFGVNAIASIIAEQMGSKS